MNQPSIAMLVRPSPPSGVMDYLTMVTMGTVNPIKEIYKNNLFVQTISRVSLILWEEFEKLFNRLGCKDNGLNMGRSLEEFGETLEPLLLKHNNGNSVYLEEKDSDKDFELFIEHNGYINNRRNRAIQNNVPFKVPNDLNGYYKPTKPLKNSNKVNIMLCYNSNFNYL